MSDITRALRLDWLRKICQWPNPLLPSSGDEKLTVSLTTSATIADKLAEETYDKGGWLNSRPYAPNWPPLQPGDLVSVEIDGEIYTGRYGDASGWAASASQTQREPLPDVAPEDVRPLQCMTVAELIAKLQKAPPDALILGSDNELGHVDNIDAYLFNGRVYRFSRSTPYLSFDSDPYDMERKHERIDERPQTFVILSTFGEDGESL